MSLARKIALLTASVAALVAFAAPAAAQAEGQFWYVNGEKLGEWETVEADFHGSLHIYGGPNVSISCQTKQGEATISNGETEGQASFWGGLKECAMSSGNNYCWSSGGDIWAPELKLTGSQEAQISPFYTQIYSSYCGWAPKEMFLEGDITADVSEQGCFTAQPGSKMTIGGNSLNLEASFCVTGREGNVITVQ